MCINAGVVLYLLPIGFAMRRLLLLRHAKTEADAPSGRDVDRRLDSRGRDDAALMGQWLGQQERVPDLVLVSTATRAQQTWAIVAAELARATITPKAIHLDVLYGAGPAELLDQVQVEGQSAATVMVVAHNPGLHELGFALAASGDAAARTALTDNLPTGAIATLDFSTDDWSDVRFRSGHLTSFVSPKSLKG
jgi:phosphohistidine phosphatase